LLAGEDVGLLAGGSLSGDFWRVLDRPDGEHRAGRCAEHLFRDTSDE
jgi:hypothetical protein